MGSSFPGIHQVFVGGGTPSGAHQFCSRHIPEKSAESLTPFRTG